MEPIKQHHRSQGSILVVILVVVSSMTVIALGLAYQSRIEIRLSSSAAQETCAYYLALGGIEHCKAQIVQSELTPERTVEVCRFFPFDQWHDFHL